MNTFTLQQKIISSALKMVAFVSAVWGTIASAIAGKNSFMGGSTVFMYFTIQSNIALALICAAGFIFLFQKKDVNPLWFIIKFVGTVSITLTGFVFCFVLAPTMGQYAWNVQNILTHVIVPLVCIADFFVVGINSNLSYNKIIYVTIPPILYAIYAGIGYVNNWQFSYNVNYPYFFLNWGSPAGAFKFTKEFPFMGSMWWIFALLIFLLVIGYLYLLGLNGLKKKFKK